CARRSTRSRMLTVTFLPDFDSW
nr:immunoglobulin heavy chain junction region [Macaca mulatta]MOX38681.1 immunoglobulin heavy chain junction region [Macaca mulatta]MOX39063.1 immunoglobulin heavy chain junction region [Macaca mulatta]MOX39239.1 immunoglobulin heavy chain junction region [Macaca mulatta]MOX39358.1 immunoglobulin heavy chain junction region [Macaca mulatta]